MADMTRNDAERLHAAHRSGTRATPARAAPATILDNWERVPAEVPQGHAGRIPPRARPRLESAQRTGRPCRMRLRRASKVSVDGQGHRLSSRSTGATGSTRRPPIACATTASSSSRSARRRTRDQAARCMDCGIPFCHTGCPVNNQIPDWNDLVYRGDWLRALQQPPLDQQLPGVHRPHLPGAVRGSRARSTSPTTPVTIKTIECAIVDRGWAGRLDQARAAAAQDRQVGRRRRLRAGRPRLRPAARPRRP